MCLAAASSSSWPPLITEAAGRSYPSLSRASDRVGGFERRQLLSLVEIQFVNAAVSSDDGSAKDEPSSPIEPSSNDVPKSVQEALALGSYDDSSSSSSEDDSPRQRSVLDAPGPRRRLLLPSCERHLPTTGG
eukprot:CAMPEP_0184382056 /NCGR_PEP_ID=MMETSP0007-20130409/6030_1 /TAXON_ID=97485 /ORGANISM="Prymnesium parvum, Strain Texoma1" /LENGTH=131 /DNA_ID=CAMNT_0026727937 /DNA_START=31 /DNA_END=426 /DNA_ORIENTATION=-